MSVLEADGAVVSGAVGGAVDATISAGDASVYLQPGHVYADLEPSRITTILGSCVAVCLHDRARSWGGMNHFLLPQGTGREPSPRFAPTAMSALLLKLLSFGGRRRDLEAKVFGGARILSGTSARRDLGSENVEAALDYLGAEGIPVVAQHTGGTRGRKLIFHTRDGIVWMKSF